MHSIAGVKSFVTILILLWIEFMVKYVMTEDMENNTVGTTMC